MNFGMADGTLDKRTVRDDRRAGRPSQADFEHRLEQSGRLVAQMLDVALAFRDVQETDERGGSEVAGGNVPEGVTEYEVLAHPVCEHFSHDRHEAECSP